MPEKDTDKRFSVRMPEDLYKDVEALAEQDLRSTHMEVIALVREAVAARKQQKDQQERRK